MPIIKGQLNESDIDKLIESLHLKGLKSDEIVTEYKQRITEIHTKIEFLKELKEYIRDEKEFIPD